MHRTWYKAVCWQASLLFLVILTVYLASPISTSFDSRWALPTADSLLRSGNTDLVEFRDLIELNEGYGIVHVEGQPYAWHPIGAALMALPFLAVLEPFQGLEIREKIAKNQSGGIERGIASFIVALTASVLFLTCRRDSYGTLVALLTALVFAFGTSAWSTASRALWQHGPSMLMVALGHYALLAARDRPRAAVFAGLPLAFAFVIRPTNAITTVVLSTVIMIRHRRQLPAFLILLSLVLLIFTFYSLSVFGQLFPPYHAFGEHHMALTDSYVKAVVGQIVSPNRGIFFFSPVLLFAAVGLMIRIRQKCFGLIEAALIISILGNPLVVGTAPMWWGGHSYGPRYFTDVLPFACFFLAPFLAAIPNWLPRPRRLAALAFAIVLAFSVFVHYRGSFQWSVYEWNAFPNNVDENPSRIWDFTDLQFLPCISKFSESRRGC